jgi:hypothetical protein
LKNPRLYGLFQNKHALETGPFFTTLYIIRKKFSIAAIPKQGKSSKISRGKREGPWWGSDPGFE